MTRGDLITFLLALAVMLAAPFIVLGSFNAFIGG